MDAELLGDTVEEAFVRRYADVAAENGDAPDLQIDSAGPGRPMASAIDDERGVLYLVVADFRSSEALETLNASQLTALINRGRRLAEAAMRQRAIAEGGEECALNVADRAHLIKRIQLLVFSNARLSTRRPPELTGELDGRPLISSVLDFDRLTTIEDSRGAAEPLRILLPELHGKPLPCLRASGTAYESLLIAIPANLLASIYALYGARLMEQNVRTFLQARTKVNKGIIATLRDCPEMFLAYNNGITATASAVGVVPLPDGGLGLESIEDLQIVNGGQTTASILYARDHGGARLSDAFVQMKLTVVPTENVPEVVPRISRYANTQNRIREADFFSGHPFHIWMEQLSRRLTAPPRPGAAAGSRWFYERARGQYRDARSRSTPAERRRFDAEFPKSQMIEKTDLAKVELSFEGRPHIVCLGAQKCFVHYAEKIARVWETSPHSFNESWFRTAVAQTMLYRWLDRSVGVAEWYREDRGYKAQTVAYAIAKIMHDIRGRGHAGLNLQLLWSAQYPPEELQEALNVLAPQIAAAIRDTPDVMRNVAEYCKQQACWATIARLQLEYPALPEALLVDEEEIREEKKAAATAVKLDNDIEFDRLLLRVSGRAAELQAFARKRALLSPRSDMALKKLSGGNPLLSTADRSALRQLFQRMAQAGYSFPASDGAGSTAEGAQEPRTIVVGTAVRQVRT